MGTDMWEITDEGQLVEVVGGSPHLGSDPEMTDANQIIQEMKWMTFDEIKKYPKKEQE